MSFKEILESLDPQKREQLMVAFEQGITQIIKLPDNKFIGVNVVSTTDLQIIEEANGWYYGKLDSSRN